jgi:hypothetical protein
MVRNFQSDQPNLLGCPSLLYPAIINNQFTGSFKTWLRRF